MNEHVRELSDGNWDQEVLAADVPVLVDFWADWCAPCRMIAPTIDDVAAEFAGRIKVGKLNVDDSPDVAARYGIRSIPTLLIFRGASIVEQRVGALPRAELVRVLEAQLAGAGAPARG